MRPALLRNPEVRGIALGFLAVSLLIAAAAAVGIWSWWRAFSAGVIQRDAALIGRVLSSHPELESEILSVLTRGATPEEEAAGAAAAGRYGYAEALPPFADPFLRGPFTSLLAIAAAVFLIGGAAYALVLRRVISRLYGEIRRVADGVESIVQGGGIRLAERGEGEVSLLSHRVNEMAGRLSAAVEQLGREKDFLKSFLADVSHQLKTPLSSVKMFADLLLGEDLDHERRKDFLDKSRQQIERMEWLIANLLSCARMEADAVEFHITSSPLDETIGTALEGLRPAWEAKGVGLAWRPPAGHIVVPHDRRWIAEALSNIVKNAVEHTPKGGHVEVVMEDDPVLARVTVTDSGEGIAREDVPGIFARFFRTPSSGHEAGDGPRPVSGTGIGLALAKAIVERHGGVVSVSSAPGAGTAFSVTLHKIDI
jgi:signal transduction histidine kinase